MISNIKVFYSIFGNYIKPNISPSIQGCFPSHSVSLPHVRPTNQNRIFKKRRTATRRLAQDGVGGDTILKHSDKVLNISNLDGNCCKDAIRLIFVRIVRRGVRFGCRGNEEGREGLVTTSC